jgi:hypothetical protein
MKPTRADRCVYVYYKNIDRPLKRLKESGEKKFSESLDFEGRQSLNDYQTIIEQFMEKMLDPEQGSPAYNKTVLGVIVLHVDDLFIAGDYTFHTDIINRLKADYQIGSEDRNDITFCGQRIRWRNETVMIDQDKAVE